MRLAEIATLSSPWQDFHERGRPSALGQGPVASASQHFAGLGHEKEELERRFARDVATFLHEQSGPARSGAGGVRLHVFAAPRFLGHLRDALGPIGDGIELFRGEFAGLRANEVAAHPTVRAIVGASAPALLAGGPHAATGAPTADARGAD